MVSKTSKHATFQGTFGDYHYHIGPSIRNRIQAITRKRRFGPCANPGCSHVGQLDAAHKPDRSRPDIIEEILHRYVTSEKDGFIECNLNDVLHEIEAAHRDFDQVFDFICKACHNKQGQHRQGRSSGNYAHSSTEPSSEMTGDERNFVVNRIKGWATKRGSNVHRIIATFLAQAPVSRLELTHHISSISSNPGGALASLMTSKGNAYGRIFITKNGFVEFHPEIVDEIKKHRWRAPVVAATGTSG